MKRRCAECNKEIKKGKLCKDCMNEQCEDKNFEKIKKAKM